LPSAKAAKAPPPRTWSAVELRAFLEHVAEDRLYALWLTYATTGLRRGEALGIRWAALDAGTVAALRAHRKSTVSKRFAELVRGLDVPRVSLHGLRHTWASLALQAGVNPKVVSERLGHATVAFTLDRYSHVMPGMQEDAAARVAALISGT
jgi:integrase